MPGKALTSDRTITAIARTGYAARGILYMLVGGLTVLAVLGQGGQTTGSRGAMQSVLAAPFGTVMLLLLALGLVCYALWRGIQAIRDPDHHGTSPQGLAIRAGLMASAVTHLILATFSVMITFTIDTSGGGSESSTQGTVGWVMSQPHGRWMISGVGVLFGVVGLAHHIKAWKTDFDRSFDMPTRSRHWAYPMFRFALTIRGLVFMIVGGLFVAAAYQINPEQAGGTNEALNTLRAQPFGRWLLGTVATGLFAFGLYSGLEAMYRRVNPSA